MSESQKFSFLDALNNTVRTLADDARHTEGVRLPCHVVNVSGAIVTVQFDILPGAVQFPEITVPVAGFEYIRYPIQPGDKGVTLSADVSLRGVSGLGSGIADLSVPPSMTALYFVPLSSQNWSEEDPDKITLYGPAGALIKTADGKSSITVGEDKITLTSGGQTLELSSSGLMHNGVNIGATHKHDVEGVQSGDSTRTSEVPK